MRVLTVTFNPAIDQTVTLDRLVPGEVHRAHAVRQNAGGKGVNVASCLADWGLPVAAYGLLGSDNAASFDALLGAKRIEDRFIRIPGATRVNLKLVDAAGTTDINLDGIAIDLGRAEMVAATIGEAAQAEDIVVLAGSLPPGCPPDTYAALTHRLSAKGCRVVLDTSGLPLKCALEGSVLPRVIKPNRHELAQFLGRDLPDGAALVAAAQALQTRGVGLVVVSMGEDGALFVSREGALCARLAIGRLASTVGAGDAMVAGIVAALAEGASLERTARLATAFAVAKLGMAGPNLPDLASVEALAAEVVIAPATGGEALGEALSAGEQ
ncbi:1-phosphofructokinase [Novosphingobium sp. 1949]|uniref:Phosphofructokinase n=1 Tax=Novosphingobium organovorum TaxID=2930092 RepID=A0ABT0BEN3_9SPHN|nr:1-phosphofructokinase [Novosphingobium organovorum]MCJ2183491.1 1-phosphofructokinase [Novosphingobium organovorum]